MNDVSRRGLLGLFAGGAMAAIFAEEAASAQFGGVYRRNTIPYGGSNGGRNCRETSRTDQEVYNIGRDYVEERRGKYEVYLRNERPDAYDFVRDSAPFGVGSLQNRALDAIHPRNYIGGEVGRIMDDFAITRGNSRATAQSWVRAENNRAPDVIKAIIAERNVKIAEYNRDPYAIEKYTKEADDVYLKLGNQLDANEARTDCQAQGLLERFTKRAIPRILGPSPFRR